MTTLVIVLVAGQCVLLNVLVCGDLNVTSILVSPALQCTNVKVTVETSTANSTQQSNGNSSESGQPQTSQTCSEASSNCKECQYRSFDGSCNNLNHTTWGMPHTPYGRLLPYNYADGISALPVAKSGRPLPNPREISLRLFPDKEVLDAVWNLNAQQWGQIIAHDMSFTTEVMEDNGDTTLCCDANGQLDPDAKANPSCAPILIPLNDSVHLSQGTEYMNFTRAITTRNEGCTPKNAPAEPLTTVTAFMDLSLVYGNSKKVNAQIREGSGGRLSIVMRNQQKWPPQVPNVKRICPSAMSSEEPCYLTGDVRTNQNPQLACLQISLLRKHNDIADSLAKLNPHWDDETLFQEARRINIAIFQHINYYEYLPIFLGFENMVENKLIYPGTHDYVNDYEPDIDPSVLDEHATAAYRHFHTLICGHLKLISKNYNLVGTVRLSDWFNRPQLLELNNNFEYLMRGLTIQEQYYSDQFWDSEITQYLFKPSNDSYGDDLRAIDIQRGRDHGLGTYVAMREACGLSVPCTFDEMLVNISKENVEILKRLYESPQDVELVVAGSLEYNVPGALAGPTFLCILTKQFLKTRIGDRYFYENGQDSCTAFTLRSLMCDPEIVNHVTAVAFPATYPKKGQLEAIRSGATMAGLICDTVKGVTKMQPNAFKQITDSNSLKLCSDLPHLNLTAWKDTSSS